MNLDNYNICIIKPNKSSFSETSIQEHIHRLSGNKTVLYGGAFPVYEGNDSFLIKSKLDPIQYLFQKRILKKKDIRVRTKALVTYLQRENINVVLAEYGMVGSMVAEACKQAKVPLVIHFHGADAYHKKTLAEYRPFYRSAFNYASALIAVSLDMVDTLVMLGAEREKVHFVSCGVDVEKFKEIEITSFNNFISVGRFVEKKSPLSVIKAFKILTEKQTSCKLWMVGNGPLFLEAEKLVKELNLENHITLTGAVNHSEIRRLLSQSKCYIQHSVTAQSGDMEGTPVAILEAAASGLPIISTRHAGIKQAVLEGESGFLVDEYDIKSMAERMLFVSQMPLYELEKMGAAGRRHIVENYSMNNQIKKLDKIIQNTL